MGGGEDGLAGMRCIWQEPGGTENTQARWCFGESCVEGGGVDEVA